MIIFAVVQYFSQNFQRLFPTQFAVIVANFMISSFVFQAQL